MTRVARVTEQLNVPFNFNLNNHIQLLLATVLNSIALKYQHLPSKSHEIFNLHSWPFNFACISCLLLVEPLL